MADSSPIKVALTGPVGLELVASYFRDAGFEVMKETETIDSFKPDVVYDVTAHDAVLSQEVEGFFDPRMSSLAGMPYSRAGLAALVEEFRWSLAARNLKVLAVDADETLWRGILSEDGVAALKPYRVFQAGLRALRDAGVTLVLLSKNNPLPRDVPVDLDLFAAQGVNWAPKAGNLLAILRDLNLSADSVLFLDDNPHERAEMAAHLPEVVVAPWNGHGDSSRAEVQLVRRLREYFFASFGSTEEDRLRAADYANRAARTAVRRAYANHEDYLKALRLHVHPARATEEDLDRLVQMAGKTNQFNATTLRRSRDELAARLENTFVFRAGDRFGEQGLVAYVIFDPASRRLTDFVMSCRAMGRTLEYFALSYVEKALGFRPEIDFTPSAKNQPFAAFLKTLESGISPTAFEEV